MPGGISLNFELDYQLLNEKMAEFLDKHSDEINKIVGQCFRVGETSPTQRMREIKGSVTTNIPPTEKSLDNLFGGGNN